MIRFRALSVTSLINLQLFSVRGKDTVQRAGGFNDIARLRK
jgi:hypothetical protein